MADSINKTVFLFIKGSVAKDGINRQDSGIQKDPLSTFMIYAIVNFV